MKVDFKLICILVTLVVIAAIIGVLFARTATGVAPLGWGWWTRSLQIKP